MNAATKPHAPMALQLEHHRFSYDEYLAMAEHGIFQPGARVELLAGEIVDMSPIGHPHTICVTRLVKFFVLGLADRAVVQSQSTLWLRGNFIPEPDLVILRPRADEYLRDPVEPSDIALLIEVADSSLRYDRTTKLRFYAQTGIDEYWIVDLNGGRIEACTDPTEDGRYRTRRTIARSQALSPRAFPEIVLDTTALLRF